MNRQSKEGKNIKPDIGKTSHASFDSMEQNHDLINQDKPVNAIDKSDGTIKKLRKQLEWYKSFFDNATDAVFIVEPETWKVIEANDYATFLVSTPRNELLTSTLPQFRRIFKLLNKSDSPTVLSASRACQKTSTTCSARSNCTLTRRRIRVPGTASSPGPVSS